MGITKMVSVAALCLYAGIARAEDCISAGEMQTIATHFTQFRDLANGRDYCFDGSPTSQLLKGIVFMRQTRFAEAMPKSSDELFSGAFGNDWYSYFIERITDFQIDSTCEPGVIAFVRFWGTTMFVCPLALTNALSALDRASVFMHEARHIDGYLHVTCARGARAGMRGACDTRISDQGSYAVTVETYAQISRYAVDLHPALRAFARTMAIVYASEAFNTPVRVESTPRFLAITADRRFHALDLASVTARALGSLPLAGRIVPRAQHMVLIPDDKTLGARYVFARDEGETTQSVGDLMAAYDAASPARRAELVDVHSGGQWFAHAYRDGLRFNCAFGPVAPVEVRLDEAPLSFVYPDGYARDSASAHLMLNSGRVVEVGCAGVRSAFVRPSPLTYDRAYRRMHRLGDDTLALGLEGRLYRINAAGNGALLGVDLGGPVVELVPDQLVRFLDEAP